MTHRRRKRAISEEPASHRPDAVRSLLVPLDLSPASDRVLARVGLLPLAEKARLTLLHVVPMSLPPRAQRRAQSDGRRALAEERTSLAKALPKRVTVEAIVRVGVSASEIAAHANAAKAELVVMGRGGGRGLRDLFLGSTAERVIRCGQLPVLAVWQPARTAYQRPALALDLDQEVDAVLGMLLRLIPPPRSRVAVIHAYNVPYRGHIYPSLSEEDAEEDRDYYRHKALDEISRRLTTALARSDVQGKGAPWWRMQVRPGDPRTVIRNIVKKEHTDILALATHGYRGVAHAFLGTVAGDVLRAVTCDVLVVPPSQGTSGAI